MDSEILKGFIEEAESYVPAIRGGILLHCQGKATGEEMPVAIKQTRTIRGAATMIGLSEIGELASEVEVALKSFSKDSEVNDQEETAVLNKISKLEAAIANLRLSAEDFELDADKLIEDTFEEFQSAEFSAEEIAVATEEAPAEDSFEDFEIDEEMLEIFAMEAEDHLRNINEHLEKLEANPNERESLLEIRRSAHTLKGSAGIVGLARLSNLAHKVEDLLDYISENNIDSNEELFNVLLASTECISVLINNKNMAEFEDQIKRTSERCDLLLRSLKSGGESEQVVPEPAKPTKLPVKKKAVAAPVVMVDEEKKHEIPKLPQHRSVIRVSLEKLDDLVGLVGELVFSRSVFENRLSELEQQIEELHLTTRRLQRSTGRLDTDFEGGMPGVQPQSALPSISGLSSGSDGLNFDFKDADFGSLEFDSLEFDRYTGFHETTRELLETTSDAFSINSELDTVHSFLEMLFDSQKRLIDELQDKLLSLRMVNFGTLGARLQRTVRVTAEEEEKQVELNIKGESLDVDTQILDTLVDPLLHLLRNAVAHGIEDPETRRLLGKTGAGQIDLEVYSEGTHIIMTVTDDGRGISPEALKKKAVIAWIDRRRRRR